MNKTMNNIYLNSVVTNETIDEIKFLTLYYDKVSVINDKIYTIAKDEITGNIAPKDISFLPESFEEEYRYLIDEGVLEIVNRKEDESDTDFDLKYAKSISEFINNKFDYLFPMGENNIIISDEIKDIIKYTFNKNSKIPLDLIWWFYAFKLKRSLKLLIEGERCLNSSPNLQYLFEEYISLNTQKAQYFESAILVKRAINMSLPSVDMLCFEDILELKLKLKDELECFSDAIKTIEFKYKHAPINVIQHIDYDIIFKQEIQNPYKDLHQKIRSLKRKTFMSFVDKAKNIKSYVPVIGSFVASIPLKYSLLFSMGLISLETYMEYKNRKEELDNNGLNYLIKLNNNSR